VVCDGHVIVSRATREDEDAVRLSTVTATSHHAECRRSTQNGARPGEPCRAHQMSPADGQDVLDLPCLTSGYLLACLPPCLHHRTMVASTSTNIFLIACKLIINNISQVEGRAGNRNVSGKQSSQCTRTTTSPEQKRDDDGTSRPLAAYPRMQRPQPRICSVAAGSAGTCVSRPKAASAPCAPSQ
jgi:hypothetical protein